MDGNTELVTNKQVDDAILCNEVVVCDRCDLRKTDRCKPMRNLMTDGAFAIDLKNARQQRDTAWQELREIREAIKADENESTADEVRSLVAQRDELLAALDSIILHLIDEKNWVAARLVRKKYMQGETCALCGGSGKLDGESCWNCEGTGTI